MSNPDERAARKIERAFFLRLGSVQESIVERARQHLEKYPGGSVAFQAAVETVRQDLLHHAAHPDTGPETIDVNAAPWPNPDDFPPDVAPVPEPIIEPVAAEPDPPVTAPLGYDDEASPEQDEIDRLKAENDALKKQVAELTPQPLPPNPAEARLSDYGAVGDDRSVPDNVAKLMAEDPTLTLTAAFERRINTLNNARLKLTIKPEEAEELDALLDEYHELAKRGDRS